MASIQGRVVEYWTRKAVQGAVVQAAGRTAVTGSSGMFSVEVPMGAVTLRVTHPEFHEYVAALNVTAPTSVNVGDITMQSRVRAL